jgi:methylenetetrahydrofolate dehydrogenase (NADP+)/methenyltetrahydrofolate cyclohydrolase
MISRLLFSKPFDKRELFSFEELPHMTAKILDGRLLADKIKKNLKSRIEELKQKPGLVFLYMEGDEAAETYEKGVKKGCEETGILFNSEVFPKTIHQKEILERIFHFNQRRDIHGILVQFPLQPPIDSLAVAQAIAVWKDVDGVHPMNRGFLLSGKPQFIPCTPKGIVRLLEENEIFLEGKQAVILGRSTVVGLPLSLLLVQKNATVTICHSKTRDWQRISQGAQLLVVAIGKPCWVKKEHVTPGVVVVDVGIHNQNGKIVGDVDFQEIREVASFITPVPGGVGPMTVASLLENTFQAFQVLSRELDEKRKV